MKKVCLQIVEVENGYIIANGNYMGSGARPQEWVAENIESLVKIIKELCVSEVKLGDMPRV